MKNNVGKGYYMKILMITDLEGVNGVLNFADWCTPAGYRNEAACRFLTEEVNAVLAGFFEVLPEAEIVVWDGHGHGSIRGELLDPRAALQRGIVRWPRFEEKYDAVAFVGQHAKAGCPRAHLAHTQTEDAVDFRINGVSVGEFGQLAYALAENGAPTIFASGDLALTREALELEPGIYTVAVKEGLTPAVPPEMPTDDIFANESVAIHYPRKKVLEDLRIQAAESLGKFQTAPECFRLRPLNPPYHAEAEYRRIGTELRERFGDLPARTIRTASFPTVTEALAEFYSELEWSRPDGVRIVALPS